ncbi:MAG: L-lactate permease [Deltaproteobacteria bacterium]|nr:L-lactate permease [Deltaproteobacteria bacterium]
MTVSLNLFLLCWTPVLLLTGLAVIFRRPAFHLSIYGGVFTLALVVIGFGMPLVAALLAALDGALTTLPLLLVIFAGILLSNLLISTGSLTRIVDRFLGNVHDAFHRGLFISLGVGNFMEGASVIAEPVVAPMLRTAGVDPTGAAALSIIGYAGLMTLEMGGIIVDVLSLVTGLPVRELGIASAWLGVPAMLIMAACMPIYLPREGKLPHRLFLTLGCGLLVGLTTLAAAMYLGISISGMLGGLALILAVMLVKPSQGDRDNQIFRDLAPFALMLTALLLVNTVPYLKELTFRQLVVKVRIIPIHTLTFQPFFSAYLYLFAAFGLAAVLLRIPKERVKEEIVKGAKKAWRTAVAMGLFGAMGQMIAYSGYSADFAQFDQTRNIPWILAIGLKAYSGTYYPVFVPLLGWVGTFLTGYGVASLMLFGQLQVQAAGLLGVSGTWLAAGLAVGTSVGSISSPLKIAIATPMCGAVGQEGNILRLTIPLGVFASLLIGVILWLGL